MSFLLVFFSSSVFFLSMASHLSLQLPNPFYFSNSSGSKSKRAKGNAPIMLKLSRTVFGNSLFLKDRSLLRFLFARHASPSRFVPLKALSSTAASAPDEEINHENEAVIAKADDNKMEYNRVNCLVWVLHESAKSFSLAVESLELPGSGAELAMAWNGKDVHQWHKSIAYKVAVYALLKTAIEVEILLSRDRQNNPSPVREILTPKIDTMCEYIENELSMKHPELVEWFRAFELPRITSFFTPLLKKWSMEYAGSGVAGIVVAISCCAAIGKLGSGRISCPLFTLSTEDVLVELMDLSYSLVEVEKLHQLAIEAGFELNFLYHFGAKVLPGEGTEELEFWIGLAHRKLSAAFNKDIVVSGTGNSHVLADSVATLGLFAYLGRKTRLFLSRMGIKDLDELVKDFLSYLECGSLFIYPELASISSYQCFMDVVNDELGWLDFYASCSSLNNQERKRSKQHAIQAEKDMILSTVFTVCYDVFSGFAHFSRSTQRPLDAESLAFLLRSQRLLTIFLDDYRAVYDRSCEPQKIVETGVSDNTVSAVANSSTDKFSLRSGAKQKQRPTELVLKGCVKARSQQSSELRKVSNAAETEGLTIVSEGTGTTTTKSHPLMESLLRKYGVKLASTSSDIWMGTQLLFVDVMDSLELLLMQLRSHKISKRQRKKLKRTLSDIATLIPITILMLLPVSAVGHAAMLAAMKKYVPSMIPSPYSSERLDVVKQLERTKKMEIRSWNSLEDQSSGINLEDPSSRIP